MPAERRLRWEYACSAPLGIVLRARADGRIAQAAPLLRELRRSGFRLNEMLIATTLEEAFGEPWEP